VSGSAVPPSPKDRFAEDTEVRDLYERHGSTLLAFLLRLTRGDRHWAEDILQETLLRAWRHPQARSADGGWSLTWLLTVARRILIDQRRAKMARPAELGDERLDERGAADDAIDRLLDAREVRAALASLPDRLRRVLVEVYVRDRSVGEASLALGIPPGTVKSRTYYALRALRVELERRGFPLSDSGAPAGE
jgi:RNA polymerase sigma-70 factor (ECF subfamily)